MPKAAPLDASVTESRPSQTLNNGRGATFDTYLPIDLPLLLSSCPDSTHTSS